MKCAQCGHKMVLTEGTHKYDESGLKNVLLMNIPMYRCSSCDESEIEIPHMEELHLLLAFFIVFQPRLLQADEIRYLRKHLGYSQEEFASKLGVARGTVTRWEKGSAIARDRDKHIRRLYYDKKCPEDLRFLSALLDNLPGNKGKKRIRREDWVPDSTCVPA